METKLPSVSTTDIAIKTKPNQQHHRQRKPAKPTIVHNTKHKENNPRKKKKHTHTHTHNDLKHKNYDDGDGEVEGGVVKVGVGVGLEMRVKVGVSFGSYKCVQWLLPCGSK